MTLEENFIVTLPILSYWVNNKDAEWLDEYIDDINFEDLHDYQQALSEIISQIESMNVQIITVQLLDTSMGDQIGKYVLVYEYKGVTRGIVFSEDYYDGTIDFDERPIDAYPIYEPVQVIRYRPKLLN